MNEMYVEGMTTALFWLQQENIQFGIDLEDSFLAFFSFLLLCHFSIKSICVISFLTDLKKMSLLKVSAMSSTATLLLRILMLTALGTFTCKSIFGHFPSSQ